MNYEQTIAFLYQQLPMFTRIGAAAYKKDLHNTIALLDQLGNPQHRFKSIHIAGTNGKGSCSHMLAAVMQTNGYKTGLYTSPHLKDFRERIRINGEWIAEQFVMDFTEKMKPLMEQLQPSFFEVTVAMAFEWFAEQQVDIAIIETGLGGRLDSTNVIRPELSLITNIGYDHMNLLGNTLPEIAGEKAGIIKHHTPVIIGTSNDATKPVFLAKAKAEQAPIHFADETIHISHYALTIDTLSVSYQWNGQLIQYATDLPGIYQQFNLRNVLLAIELLQQHGWQLEENKNREALLHVKSLTGLGGRWELIRRNPFLVMDVAHNEDGISQVMEQLTALKRPAEQTSFIIGVAADKEVDKVLSLLPKKARYYFTNAHLPRALPAMALQEKAAIFGLMGDHFDNVNEAIKAAMLHSGKDDLIIVCGSVFVVGEVDSELFKN